MHSYISRFQSATQKVSQARQKADQAKKNAPSEGAAGKKVDSAFFKQVDHPSPIPSASKPSSKNMVRSAKPGSSSFLQKALDRLFGKTKKEDIVRAQKRSEAMNQANSPIELKKLELSTHLTVDRAKTVPSDISAVTDKGNQNLRNQYTTTNNFTCAPDSNGLAQALPTTTQFRCGSVHSEPAAQQYAAGMLLQNLSQLSSDNTIHLIDTRYLNDNQFYHGEPAILATHKTLISNVISKLLDENNRISKEKLYAIFPNLKLNLHEFNNLKGFIGKKIEFHSINLGPERGGIAGNGATDKENVKNLQRITTLLNQRMPQFGDKTPKESLSRLWLKELNEIILSSYEESGKKNSYISGAKAFRTQYLIAKLSAYCGIVPSSGCKSNKDRGTSEHIYESCLDAVFAQRASQPNASAEKFSVKNFRLETDGEKLLVRKILAQKLSDKVAEANTGKAGNKNLAGLEPLIREAFTDKNGRPGVWTLKMIKG